MPFCIAWSSFSAGEKIYGKEYSQHPILLSAACRSILQDLGDGGKSSNIDVMFLAQLTPWYPPRTYHAVNSHTPLIAYVHSIGHLSGASNARMVLRDKTAVLRVDSCILRES